MAHTTKAQTNATITAADLKLDDTFWSSLQTASTSTLNAVGRIAQRTGNTAESVLSLAEHAFGAASDEMFRARVSFAARAHIRAKSDLNRIIEDEAKQISNFQLEMRMLRETDPEAYEIVMKNHADLTEEMKSFRPGFTR